MKNQNILLYAKTEVLFLLHIVLVEEIQGLDKEVCLNV